MTDADERDDGCRFEKIEVPFVTSEQSPKAEAEGGRGTERDQGVHIGTADFQLVPGSPIKLRAGEDLNDSGEYKRKPLEPAHHSNLENPLTDHQWRRTEDGDDEVHVPTRELLLAVVMLVRRHDLCTVALVFNRLNERGNIVFAAGCPTNGSMAGIEAHSCAPDARDILNRLGDMPCAVPA